MDLRSLLCLALIHTLVDGYAQVISPLWPHLKQEMAIGPWSLTAIFAGWQMATSVSQPLFGYWGDRTGTRFLLAIGPALAIVCISLIGFAGSPIAMAMLLVIGGLGIGSFHPEAAVCVAEAAGARLTGGLAIFAFGGMMGLGLGPIASGIMAEKYGLQSLIWVMVPSLILLALFVILQSPIKDKPSIELPRVGLADMLRGKWLAVTGLLAVSTLRAVPAIGVPLGLAFLLHDRGRSDAEIGAAQSIFLLSGSLGTLICPLFARPGRELHAVIGTTLLAMLCLTLVSLPKPILFYGGLAGSGLVLQGAIPIVISYSQRLLPRGRRVAASLTLGTSWGLAGLIVAVFQAYFASIERLNMMLWAMVPFGLAAALVASRLPDITVPGPGPLEQSDALDAAMDSPGTIL